jgi:hypothetical protein
MEAYMMRKHLMAATLGAAIACLSNASFAQEARGYVNEPGVRYDAYDQFGYPYGPSWQYHGGPKSTSTTDLIYPPPIYQPYSVAPPDGYLAR